MSAIRAALKFIRILPDLMRATRRQGWLLRLPYLAACYRLYQRESLDNDRRQARPRCGNPALRASCCDARPAAYPENQRPADLPELAGLLQPVGISWGGHIQFYDCTVCGQEWLLDWQPTRHGGIQQLKKLGHERADG